MTQTPTGENESNPSDDEYTHFIGGATAHVIGEREALSAEKQRISKLTELLDPNCPVVCLLYPDDTYNLVGIDLFDGRSVDENPLGNDVDAEIKAERSLYATILGLLRMADNPSDPGFFMISDGKKLLIALWMHDSRLPFESGWVTFLRDNLPGGDVSVQDIEDAYETHQESERMTLRAQNVITEILTDGHPEVSMADRELAFDKASQYFFLGINLINELVADNMSPGEFNKRLAQMGKDFGISSEVHYECLKVCAEWCGYEFGDVAY